MRRLEVWRRKIADETALEKGRYVVKEEVTVIYGDSVQSNHVRDWQDKKLAIPFRKEISVQSAIRMQRYASGLGDGEGNSFIKGVWERIKRGL